VVQLCSLSLNNCRSTRSSDIRGQYGRRCWFLRINMALETVGSLQLVPVVCLVDVVDMALLPQTTRTNQARARDRYRRKRRISYRSRSRTDRGRCASYIYTKRCCSFLPHHGDKMLSRCLPKSDMQQSEYPRCRDATHGNLGAKLKMSGFG
jgi:hypothetical protein